MLFNAFIVMSYYAVVFSWHIIYFFVSFGMQWRKDANAYFFNNVLQVSNKFNGFTQFSLPVFIALIIAWVIIFFYVRKGFESIKRGFLAIFPVLIFLTIFFLLYALTLDNALDGVYSFLNPKAGNLLNFDVWINSFSLAVLSIGLSFGIMHTIARKSGKGFIFGASSIIAVFEVLTSIAIGFIIFGILGFLGTKQGLGFEKLMFSDYSFPFTVLAQALPFFYKPNFLGILFFIFLAVFFVLGTSSLAYSITHVLVHKFKTKHFNAAVFVSGTGFLLGLLFIIKPGFYIMDVISHFIYYNILIALLLEALAVGWFFDCEKISQHINQNSVLKIGAVWEFFIRYFIPLILFLLLFFRIKSDFLLNYNNYPWWAVLIFGIGTVVIPVVAAFLMPQKILDRR